MTLYIIFYEYLRYVNKNVSVIGILAENVIVLALNQFSDWLLLAVIGCYWLLLAVTG